MAANIFLFLRVAIFEGKEENNQQCFETELTINILKQLETLRVKFSEIR